MQDGLSFEDFKNQNGMTFWWASEVAVMLGYADLRSFAPVINRATKAFTTLGVDVFENIIKHRRQINGVELDDYKMSRFACYVAAMNGDPRKPQVAAMQAYFAVQTHLFEEQYKNGSQVDRLIIREDIREAYKSLSATADASGVRDYARFANAGYLGMYNMLNVQLAERRGVPKQRIFDTMGRTELAANLFRITQTEERIKSQGVRGQERLEQTHRDVGREIRRIVINNTGAPPEQLPQEQNLPDVKKAIKRSHTDLKKIDANQNKNNK